MRKCKRGNRIYYMIEDKIFSKDSSNLDGWDIGAHHHPTHTQRPCLLVSVSRKDFNGFSKNCGE
jgi:hypothetical protein